MVDIGALPPGFPTHRHEPAFWERLGRAVATFGFLEEVLGKAIFSFTARKPSDASELEEAYREWLPTLEKALTDALGALVDGFERAVRAHPSASVPDLEELLAYLRKAARIRNVLCHGSWRPPDAAGASTPLYVERGGKVFATAVDIAYLDEVQREVAELGCAVIESVTRMGWPFPGSGERKVPLFEG